MHIDIQRNNARTMRKNMTSAERKLWSALRGRRLSGFRFNRQVEIGPYIVDFVCREHRVIVEVDGETHGDAQEVVAATRRTEFLNAKGYIVFRAWNHEVYTNLEGVLDALFRLIEDRAR